MNENNFINALRRAIQPIKDRIYMLAGRAIIAAVNDGEALQELQLKVLSGEALSKVQNIQGFGFASNPPVGSEAIILSMGGARANSVVIATDNRKVRLKNLASGETAIYTDDGTYLHLKKAGQVEVKAATLLTVDVPDALFKGNVKIEGTLEVDEATTLNDTLLVKENVTMLKDLSVVQNIVATLNISAGGIISAAGFSGPSGGPVVASVDITTTGVVTGSNVVGGGTDLATVVSVFNSHTHDENGTGGGTTNAPNTTL